MRTITIALLLVLSDAAAAQTQQRTFQDANGRTTGRAATDSHGNTTFYDAMGRNTGRSVTQGNTTTVYDSKGHQTGIIRSTK